MFVLALVLAALWGAIWAATLQFTTIGEFLATSRTWLTVVIGIGVDMLILTIIINWQTVAIITAVIAASAVPIVTRSIYNELQKTQEALNVYTDTLGE